MNQTPASRMTTKRVKAELSRLGRQWNEFRDGLDGMAGSPGEWMVERMDELETVLKRRKNKSTAFY